FRLGWTRAGSTVLCGLLLIGGNALLFVAERRVPIGLASLIFASVPLRLVVAAALSWAIGTFLSSRLPMPGDAVTTAGIQGLTGGLLLIPVGMALSDGESLNPEDWSTRSLL